MSQFNAHTAAEDELLTKFNSTLEQIINATLKIAEIIKEIENSADNEIIDTKMSKIHSIYDERKTLSDTLKSMFESTIFKENLVINNPLWDKYDNEISIIELHNTEFLKKKLQK